MHIRSKLKNRIERALRDAGVVGRVTIYMNNVEVYKKGDQIASQILMNGVLRIEIPLSDGDFEVD